MTTYTAAIGTAADVVAGEFCDVSVIVNDADEMLTDDLAMNADTAVPVNHPDVLGVVEEDAERVLKANGWRITGTWTVADNALYAPVERS